MLQPEYRTRVTPTNRARTAARPERILIATAERKRALNYINDGCPGIRRQHRGKGFVYIDARGKKVKDKALLERIRALAIPPAWTNVWICPDDNGHIQATGRDARGRKQYRYHVDFRAFRDSSKFERLCSFASELPRLRRRVAADIARPGLPREKVLATVVRLLELTSIRVGNEEYARSNGSYGLTTIKDKHVKPIAGGIRFRFKGKSGVDHDVELSDRRLAKIVLGCQELPGQDLFQYLDADGSPVPISSQDVNGYIRSIIGEQYSAKDFRTWRGTVLAALELERLGAPASATQAKREVAQVVKDVSAELRNRPATCRKYYIHPTLIEAYARGELAELMERSRAVARRKRMSGISLDEQAVHHLLSIVNPQSCPTFDRAA